MRCFAIASIFAFCASACASAGIPSRPGDDDDSDVVDAGSSTNTIDGAPGLDAGEPESDAAVVAVLLNEFVADHVSGDTNEYVEVIGPASTDLSDHFIVVIDGDQTRTGIVLHAQRLGATNAAGLFVTSYFEGVLQNGSQTVLLLTDFTGEVGDDLDTDDNGALDITPFSSRVDAVSINDGNASDLTYGRPILDRNFDGANQTVGGASRMADDTDTPADWVRNNFAGAGLPCCSGAVAAPGEAVNTPGAANSVQP